MQLVLDKQSKKKEEKRAEIKLKKRNMHDYFLLMNRIFQRFSDITRD